MGLDDTVQIDGNGIGIAGGLNLSGHRSDGSAVPDLSPGGLLGLDRKLLVTCGLEKNLVAGGKAHGPLLCREGPLVDNGMSYQIDIARLGMNGSKVLDGGFAVSLKLH